MSKISNLQARVICSFDWHLKACKYCNIIKAKELEQVRQALEVRRKELKKHGRENKPKKAEAISDNEVNISYETKLLGITNLQTTAHDRRMMQKFNIPPPTQLCSYLDIELFKASTFTVPCRTNNRKTCH